MESYVSEYPGIQVDASYKRFFEEFYKISDTPMRMRNMHTNSQKTLDSPWRQRPWLERPVGACVWPHSPDMPTDVFLNKEILAFRRGMWEKVSSRAHFPEKVYPFGVNSDEFMLYGVVKYEFKEGKKASMDWAARAHLTKEDGVLKMDFYQVYFDTAAQAAAK